jgi:hypothetical protein
MARGITVSFRGLKEVNAKLKQMDDSVNSTSMRSLMLAGADAIRARSLEILKSHTPRSSKARGGWAHLEDAIVAQSGKSETYMKAWAKTIHKLAPQGIWLEFGHKIVGHKPNMVSKGEMTKARPFFKPAVAEMLPRVKSLINLGIRRMLEGGTLERQIKITAGGNVSRRR